MLKQPALISSDLIYTLRQTIWALHPTFEKLFTGAKVQHKAQKIGVGGKTVYDINPSSADRVPYFSSLTKTTSLSMNGIWNLATFFVLRHPVTILVTAFTKTKKFD